MKATGLPLMDKCEISNHHSLVMYWSSHFTCYRYLHVTYMARMYYTKLSTANPTIPSWLRKYLICHRSRVNLAMNMLQWSSADLHEVPWFKCDSLDSNHHLTKQNIFYKSDHHGEWSSEWPCGRSWFLYYTKTDTSCHIAFSVMEVTLEVTVFVNVFTNDVI